MTNEEKEVYLILCGWHKEENWPGYMYCYRDGILYGCSTHEAYDLEIGVLDGKTINYW